MKHPNAKLLGWLLTAIIIALPLGWYAGNGDAIARLPPLQIAPALLLLPLALSTMLLIGLSNQVVAARLGASLRPAQWSRLGFASTFANHFLPMKAGVALRGAYYKLRCRLPLSHFAGLATTLYLVGLAGNALLALACYAWLAAGMPLRYPAIPWLLAGIVVASLVALRLDLPRLHLPWPRLNRLSRQLRQGWAACRGHRGALLGTLALALAVTANYALRLSLAFLALGTVVDPVGCLFIGAMVSVSSVISVTPASLGVREATILLGGAVLGVDPALALAAGLVDRLAAVLVVAVVGGWSLHRIRAEINVDTGRAGS